MLIISEENEKLKGTTYKLPDDIFNIFKNIVVKATPSNDTSYVKAKNVIKDGGYVTMEWLKNMKHYFKKHENESDPEFLRIGGYPIKYYVETTLDRITSTYGRAEHTNSPTKIRQNSSNLAGNRGEKSSKSLSIVKSLLSDVVPRFESVKPKKIIVTEEQIKILKKYL